MKNIFLLAFLFFFSVSASAQIRIEKRHYNKGWYVSLNHKKKSGDEKPERKSPENSVAAFQQEDSVLQNEAIISEPNLTNEPAFISVSQTSSSDSLLQKESFVSAKPKQIRPGNVISDNLEKHIPVERIAENIPVKSISFGHGHPTEKISRQSGPDDDWADFAESLIECLVLTVLVIGIIIGLILFGLGALIALYPAATIAILAVLGLIAIIFKA